MHKKREQMPMVGGSSLLIIFAVLCLTVFALLGLSTVQADSRLSEISAQAAADYYAADSTAEEILAALRAGNVPDGVAADGDYYSYTCPISETQELQVEVRVRADRWEILRWQAVSIARESEESYLSLWDGEIFFEE